MLDRTFQGIKHGAQVEPSDRGEKLEGVLTGEDSRATASDVKLQFENANETSAVTEFLELRESCSQVVSETIYGRQCHRNHIFVLFKKLTHPAQRGIFEYDIFMSGYLITGLPEFGIFKIGVIICNKLP